MSDRTVLDAILRQDLVAFTQRTFQTVVPGQPYRHNWHIEAIAHHLEACRHGEVRRLIVTLPPRSLKSICASVAFPAFLLGHDPDARIICASYAQELTLKHARDCRRVMESAWYRRLFPRTRIDPRKNTEAEFETTARGGRFSTSVGGTLTGRGGNAIIIDDPIKPADALSETRRATVNEWYDATLSSRLDNKKDDVIILIMQRLHVDDLVGHVREKGDDWAHLDLPAIAGSRQAVPVGPDRLYTRAPGEVLHEARESRAVLERIKAEMGSRAFSAQYQQAPVPPEGALVRRAWFRNYERPPARQAGDRLVQSWDTASKTGAANDWSVCTTWLMRGSEYYLIDVLRDRLEYPELRRRIAAHADAHRATTVLIEDAGSGAHLIQDLRREGPIRPIAIRPEGDKVMRMEAQTPRIEAGHVLLPRAAPWLEDFLAEILAFPHGRHDDQADSVFQFLGWAAAHQGFNADIALGVIEANAGLCRVSPNRLD